MTRRRGRRGRLWLRPATAAAALAVCPLVWGLGTDPASAHAHDAARDGAGAPAPDYAPPARTTDDPWADPVLRWPDPLAESQAGTEAAYYWFARADRRSRLPAATSQRPLAVWAGGDSMSGGPVYGFRQLIANDDRYVFTEDIITSTGIVTEWYFDWVAYMAGDVADGPYDVIVLAMGANDKQRFGGFPERFGEPEWNRRYQARVRALVAAAARPGRLVVWVGLPPLGTRFLASLPSVVNPLAAAALAEVDGAIFFDPSEFLAVDGNFARRLAPGQRNIRTRDGVHYTYYGGLVLTQPILERIAQHSVSD